jgi:hypothetical protein
MRGGGGGGQDDDVPAHTEIYLYVCKDGWMDVRMQFPKNQWSDKSEIWW